jgi:predicted dehydrogenase
VKSIEWFEFLSAVAKGKPASPSFADGLQVARIADAILASGEKRQWVSVEQPSRA